SPFWSGVALELQCVYVSHLFAYPLLLAWWWWRGRRRTTERRRFTRHVVAFAVANAIGFVGYVVFPAAPPWWVSLHGALQPTAELLASVNLATAMDGAIVQHTLAT